MDEKNKCYIVVSEGVRYADGTYLSAQNHKMVFSHAVGGSAALRDMIRWNITMLKLPGCLMLTFMRQNNQKLTLKSHSN